MIPANLRLMLSLRFSEKNAGVAQKTSENKPDPRTGHAREGVRHPKHRIGADLAPGEVPDRDGPSRVAGGEQPVRRVGAGGGRLRAADVAAEGQTVKPVPASYEV